MKPVSFNAARSTQRRNAAAKWDAAKLGAEFFEPSCKPRFTLPADGTYFMIGSCFARGLEAVMSQNGFAVKSISKEFDQYESAGRGRPLGSMNRYNTGSILNELRWALDPACPFPEAAIVDTNGGLSYDPHVNPTLRLADREQTLARRKICTTVMREAANADVIVITLGLTETWFDEQLGIAVNIVPDPRAVHRAPARFAFRRTTYAENLADLEAIHALLSLYAKPGHKLIITVSPIPLKGTFSDEDVVVANTHSKAILRAAAAEFVERHENVDYFPSYEIVMNSGASNVWLEDKRHVCGPFGVAITKFFIRNWITQRQSSELSDVDIAEVY